MSNPIVNVAAEPKVGDTVEVLPGTKIGSWFLGGKSGRVEQVFNAEGRRMVTFEYGPSVAMSIPASDVFVTAVAK